MLSLQGKNKMFYILGIEICGAIVYNIRDIILMKEGERMNDSTIQFNIRKEPEEEMRKTLRVVYQALEEKGYNPISQIVGYILSEDPTYITTHNNARSLVRHIDRDELLQVLVRDYLKKEEL
jgi:uncharacterized protein (UPF0297 family)